MTDETDMIAAIEKFFTASGKFELSVVPAGHPLMIPGRWLDNSDSNYSFRPADLLAAIFAWRSRATAPQDQSEILLTFGGLVRIGFWFVPNPTFSLGAAEDQKRGIYPRWAYYPTKESGEFGGHRWCEPTGWMPLPAAGTASS
jgi:hypothetical protein